VRPKGERSESILPLATAKNGDCPYFRGHEIVFQNAIARELIVANTYVIQTTSLIGLFMEEYDLSTGHLLKDQPPPAGTGLYLAMPAMKKRRRNCQDDEGVQCLVS